jgi:hypothetical protein
MESLVIEKIGKPVVEKKNLPKLKTFYPYTQIKGRLVSTRVVGVTFEGRQEIVAKLQMGDRVWLEQEPHNLHDCNAVMVSRENGEQIGYINRHLAADLVHFLRSYGYPLRGKVSLLTGSKWNNYSLGCKISFKIPKLKRSNNNGHNPSFEDFDEWDL